MGYSSSPSSSTPKSGRWLIISQTVLLGQIFLQLMLMGHFGQVLLPSVTLRASESSFKPTCLLIQVHLGDVFGTRLSWEGLRLVKLASGLFRLGRREEFDRPELRGPRDLSAHHSLRVDHQTWQFPCPASLVSLQTSFPP